MDEQSERKMYQGNWECSVCGKAITELPFEPRNTDNLKCIDCFKEGGGGNRPRRERKMYQGNWTCSNCGKAITELPFEPREGSTITCRDCFLASKNQ